MTIKQRTQALIDAGTPKARIEEALIKRGAKYSWLTAWLKGGDTGSLNIEPLEEVLAELERESND